MKLQIDSRDNLRTIVSIDSKVFVVKYSSPREQDVLGSVKNALSEEGIELKEISEIEVAQGKGSFTGIRVGMAVGRALGYALGVKLNGKTVLENEKVVYGSEPNISL